MTREEYINKVAELEKQLAKVTEEFIDSNKLYNVGDYLRISFHKDDRIITRTCKIINIYPSPTHVFASLFGNHPKGELEYFAKYAWICKDGRVGIGDVCYLGPLSHHSLICGHGGVNWKDVKIEVIDETELEKIIW